MGQYLILLSASPILDVAECVTDLNLSLLSQVLSWKSKLPLQTIMRLLQVLVPQVEKICIDKYINDFSLIAM